jgi:hypothetical protein
MKQIRYYITDAEGNTLWQVHGKKVKNPEESNEFKIMIFILNRSSHTCLYGYQIV